jgi:hypothetical protein
MQAAKSAIAPRDVASFAALDAPADELMAAPLIAAAGRIGGVEGFPHVYALFTKEGLALMVRARARAAPSQDRDRCARFAAA